MPPEDAEKAGPHAPGRDDIPAGAELADLRADHLGHARPAGGADDQGEADHTGLAPDGLEKDNQQQGGDAQEDLRQAHQHPVQPPGRQTAGRAEENGQQRGNQRSQKADGQGDPPAVPDHGEDVPAHGVRPQPESAAGRRAGVVEVHVGGILGDERLAEQTAQEDDGQDRAGEDRPALIPGPRFQPGRGDGPDAHPGEGRLTHTPPPPIPPPPPAGDPCARR